MPAMQINFEPLRNALSSIRIGLSFILLLACFFYGIRLFQYHLKIIGNDHLLEYREGAMALSGELMARGKSPYASENQPVYANNYGFLYPLVSVPAIWLFGVKPEVFRLITAVFLWLSLFLVAGVLMKKKVPALYTIAGALIFYASLLYSTNPLIRPDCLGLFLFLGSIFIPYLFNYSNKSLVVSVIMALLAFHAKSYFFLGAPLLTSYLFFTGRIRKSVMYGCATAALFILTFFFIKSTQEFYFYNTLYVNMIATSNSREYTLFQLHKFFSLNKGLIILLGIALSCIVYWVLTNRKNILISRPNAFLISFYCLTVTTLLTYLKLGGHDGAFMTYLFQLMTPFLILSALSLAGVIEKSHFLKIPFSILLIFNLYSVFAYLPGFMCNNKNEWSDLEALVKKHERILASPVLSMLLLQNNKQVYDSGLTEYFNYSGDDNLITGMFYSNKEKRIKTFSDFKNVISERVLNRDFDLIIFARGLERYASRETLTSEYQLDKTIHLCLPHTMQHWELDIYTPKSSK